jgi:hypothetical protein
VRRRTAPARAARQNGSSQEETAMVAHLVCFTMGVLAPLTLVAWLLANG